MNDLSKISASHLCRAACIYLRQSTPAQVEHNRESTQRQYALASKATTLGWPSQQVVVIDEDLGVSGSGVVARNGFARLTAEVALGHVGIVLGLEVSRLARNNADWYRLLDLCGITDTLIGDADGVYHPAMFNDRLSIAWPQRHHERSGTACATGTFARWDPQQGRTRRTASQSSRGLRLGRAGWRGLPPPRRIRARRHPDRLYSLR